MSVLKSLLYLLPYCVPALVLAGSVRGEPWAFGAVFWMFFVVTILDTLVGERTITAGTESESRASGHDHLRHIALRLWLPAQTAVLLCGLAAARNPAFEGLGLIGVAVSVGMTGGILGMPVAHELMHSRSRVDQALAEILMTLMSYTHFCVEHVHGHHNRVATAEDAASARLGENLYAFLARAVSGGFVSAWSIETSRLRTHRCKVFGLRNRILRGIVAQWAICAGIGYVFGIAGIALFAAQSVIAVFILESVNYVQHYGLSRRKTQDARYERILPWHSWNSDHPVSNWFVVNLGRHSDHHCNAEKPHQSLPGKLGGPHLPTGLFGMCVLALFPPLWRIVMDPLVIVAAKRD